MKKLKVDFEQISWAMEDQSRDINDYYLDKETIDRLPFEPVEKTLDLGDRPKSS